jgi:hypothetical protein
MRRRDFVKVIASSTIGLPLAARAQQPATQQRIAIFHPAIPTTLLTETGGGSAWRAFFAELRRLGYVEGENLIIELPRRRGDRIAPVGRMSAFGTKRKCRARRTAWLALPLGSIPALDQGQKPESSYRAPRSRGGLGSLRLVAETATPQSVWLRDQVASFAILVLLPDDNSARLAP